MSQSSHQPNISAYSIMLFRHLTHTHVPTASCTCKSTFKHMQFPIQHIRNLDIYSVQQQCTFHLQYYSFFYNYHQYCKIPKHNILDYKTRNWENFDNGFMYAREVMNWKIKTTTKVHWLHRFDTSQSYWPLQKSRPWMTVLGYWYVHKICSTASTLD